MRQRRCVAASASPSHLTPPSTTQQPSYLAPQGPLALGGYEQDFKLCLHLLHSSPLSLPLLPSLFPTPSPCLPLLPLCLPLLPLCLPLLSPLSPSPLPSISNSFFLCLLLLPPLSPPSVSYYFSFCLPLLSPSVSHSSPSVSHSPPLCLTLPFPLSPSPLPSISNSFFLCLLLLPPLSPPSVSHSSSSVSHSTASVSYSSPLCLPLLPPPPSPTRLPGWEGHARGPLLIAGRGLWWRPGAQRRWWWHRFASGGLCREPGEQTQCGPAESQPPGDGEPLSRRESMMRYDTI